MKPLNVLISSINMNAFHAYLPYVWGILKTYADQDSILKEIVNWLDPINETETYDMDRLEIDYDLSNIDVLGVSCYAWGLQTQLNIIKRVKELNPNCLVVAGGPQPHWKDLDWLKKYPMIDIIVKQDGEIPFTKILSTIVAGEKDFSDIPGLIFLDDNGITVDTGSTELIKEFKLSPWLEQKEFYKKCSIKYKEEGRFVSVFLESCRGCPYACTFCDWGSNIMSKVRLFDKEMIRQEIEWFAEIKIEYVWIVDANFGIIPQDVETATRYGSCNRSHR